MARDWSSWDDDEPPRPWWRRGESALWGVVGALSLVFVSRCVLDVAGSSAPTVPPEKPAPSEAKETAKPAREPSETPADAAEGPSAAVEDSPEATTEAVDDSSPTAGTASPAVADGTTAQRAAANKPQREWVKHEVIPGERVADIAARYQVSPAAVLRWNKLNKKRPNLRVGQKLKVYAKRMPPPREKITYEVEPGDSWIGIARKFGVERKQLRRWNHKARKNLRPGQRLRVWVDAAPEVATGEAAGSVTTAAGFPIVPIKRGATSVGSPNRGKISRPIQLPDNEALYRISNPDHAWGTTHTFQLLQAVVANFRGRSHYQGEIVIGAISRRGGGRFRPHRSHQSGRDVDIWLPVRRGVSTRSRPKRAGDVDWDATWALIAAFIDTGKVEYVFLNYARQRQLYDAARRAGVPKAKRDRLIEYPQRSSRRQAVVRHADGHKSHIHVRLRCGEQERMCVD
ncbi:MAG: LysM peptidoglycan-binding domain-containing protein [Myxococcales bacterium FL481]|nr:MAG: LysM peptidoglycan-binding domain-containing protein [Myxococcales bacterium FL481]